MSGRRREKSERPGQKAPAQTRLASPVAVKAGGGGKSPVFWASSFILILSGYIMLGKADPAGQNAWSVAAPASLLAGYLLVIPAIYSTYSRNS